jgi:hypothetical protein
VTASVRRRTSFSRALLALSGIAVLALLALAALLLGGALTNSAPVGGPEVHSVTASSVGEPDHVLPSLQAIHQQPSRRARVGASAVLGTTIVVAAWALRRFQLRRAGRLRTLHLPGLPPGRAPPALRVV